MMVGTEADMEEGMVVEAMDMTTMEEAMATTMGTAGAMDMTMVMEKAEVRGQGPAALSKAPTVSATTARYEIGDSMDMGMAMGMIVAQGGKTCGAIDEPRKSSKAINKRVIIDFRDKNIVIARFRDKNEVFI